MRRKKKNLHVLLITVLIVLAAGLAVFNGTINKDQKWIKNILNMAGLQNGSEVEPQPSQTNAPVQAGETTGDKSPVQTDPTPTATPTPTPTPSIDQAKLNVFAVGDIMLGRKVGKLLETEGKGYQACFEMVAPILKQGDIVFGNLESPLTASEKSLSKANKIILKAAPKAIEAITYAGFNLMSIANNHMMDYYDKGMFDTIDILNENGIANSGGGKNLEEARKPAIVEKNGLKYGVLSYSDMVEYTYAGNPNISYVAGKDKSGLAPRKLELILEDIEKVRPEVDILAISLHWGIEESFTISSKQVEFAHTLMDAGADVILGHHPHQFQGIEIYKGKPIIYSMGNFIFDQNDPENQEAFILNMQYTGTKLESFTAIPVRTKEKKLVTLPKGDVAKALLEREAELSRKLGSVCSIEDDKLIFKLD